MATVKGVELPALKDKEVIKSDQDKIKVAHDSLRDMIHENLMQCVMHCHKHRDTSLTVRLIKEILGQKNSAVRVQGIIAWLKHFTPMRLAGQTINLSGKLEDGSEQPFNLEGAFKVPFYELTEEGRPMLKPMYQMGPLRAIEKAAKDFREALANTDNSGDEPKPYDPAKPYYDGKNSAQILDFFTEVDKLRAGIKDDNTKNVREAQQAHRKAG